MTTQQQRDIQEAQKLLGCLGGCFFADKTAIKVFKPCCTYPGKLEYGKLGKCLKRRKVK